MTLSGRYFNARRFVGQRRALPGKRVTHFASGIFAGTSSRISAAWRNSQVWITS
jgi:hypothetical protein